MLLLENTSGEPVSLRAGHAYAQIVPLMYFRGPILGASDFNFPPSLARGDGAFGSSAARLSQLFADIDEPPPVVNVTPEPDVASD